MAVTRKKNPPDPRNEHIHRRFVTTKQFGHKKNTVYTNHWFPEDHIFLPNQCCFHLEYWLRMIASNGRLLLPTSPNLLQLLALNHHLKIGLKKISIAIMKSFIIWRCLKMGNPQVTIGFNTTSLWKDCGMTISNTPTVVVTIVLFQVLSPFDDCCRLASGYN